MTYFFRIIIFFCLVFGLPIISFARTNIKDEYPKNSDSIPFSLNVEGGWSSLQTYLHHSNDTVTFEALFSVQGQIGSDWTQAALAGVIDSSYAPATRTDFEFHEPRRTWAVIINADGKCYFRWIGGAEPPSGLFILPFFSKYKK